MKRFATLTAISTAFALAACAQADGDDDADDGADTTIIESGGTTPVPGPTVTESSTTVIRDGTPDDSVTVGPDGVEATVQSGDDRVTVDTNNR